MRSVIAVLLISLLFSCNNSTPDVSGIKINVTTQRFEKDLFDTTSPNLVNYLQHLNKNSSFTQIFLNRILSVDPRWPADTTAAYVNGFIRAFRAVYDSAEKIFNDFTPYENEIKKGLQFVKYYFPAYKVPHKIITYIGPLDGDGDGINAEDSALIIGLQVHLGKDFHLYKTSLVQETYPEYISRRFEPDYIVINSMTNILNDIFPEKEEDKPLISQMIKRGKHLYILSKLLPQTDEYKLIGYTKEQLQNCYSHEAVIWDFFVKNSLLQTTDQNKSKNYIDEGPKTQELGEGAPGNIGSFAGWQIVKIYMKKNPANSLQQLMNMDDESIFREAKYKP